MSNPSTQEGISHIFGICACQVKCFWPGSDSVHNYEEVGTTLGGEEWPYKIHIHMVKMKYGLIVLS